MMFPQIVRFFKQDQQFGTEVIVKNINDSTWCFYLTNWIVYIWFYVDSKQVLLSTITIPKRQLGTTKDWM